MSEVNADGMLLNPHEALLQQVQGLTNTLMAPEPEGMEEDLSVPVHAGNGEPAGVAGGIPHKPTGRKTGPKNAPKEKGTRRAGGHISNSFSQGEPNERSK